MVKYLIQPFSIDHYEMGMIAKPKIISEEEFLKLKESYQFIKLGILSDYEGYLGEQEYGGCFVFKFDPHKNHLEVMTKNLDRPNGIAFSHDEKKLYVADTGEDVKCLYVFDIIDNKILNQKLVYDFKPFFSDGFRCDQDGNIWTSAGKAIKCFNPNNELIGQLLVPELVSNLEFGGKEGNILYVTATSSLYKMELNQIGAKFR